MSDSQNRYWMYWLKWFQFHFDGPSSCIWAPLNEASRTNGSWKPGLMAAVTPDMNASPTCRIIIASWKH